MNKLYYAPGACSIGIHVLLEEIGKPYQAEQVDLRAPAPERKQPQRIFRQIVQKLRIARGINAPFPRQPDRCPAEGPKRPGLPAWCSPGSWLAALQSAWGHLLS